MASVIHPELLTTRTQMVPFQAFKSVLRIGTHVAGPEYEDILNRRRRKVAACKPS